MKWLSKIFVLIILFILLIPINVNANIVCNDGTVSPSCADCHRGCCSHHGGCSNHYTNSSNSSSNNVIKKSSDTSIKSVTIDGKKIAVSNNMKFETISNDINIKVVPTNSKANVKVENVKLVNGKNNISIIVTAESGVYKEYILEVTKKEVKGKYTLKKFIIGGKEISFDESKIVSILINDNQNNYDVYYELSDNRGILMMYLNGEKIDSLNNIKNNDALKLVVFDDEKNKIEYNFVIKMLSDKEIVENNKNDNNDLKKTDGSVIDDIFTFVVGGAFISGVISFCKNKKN